MFKENSTRNSAYRFKRFARKAYSTFNSMHRVVNIGVMSSCMLTFAHATQTSAQSSPATVRDSIPEQDLEEVLVIASKAELTLNQAAQLVTIITKEEIAQQPAQSIEDLLKTVVGIDVRQRGGNGVQSDISVRGGTFDQVAILLNGANLSNPQTGHYSFDLPVNLSDIERIEIIQGPSSLLYGASAFSGGINIITKKQRDTKAYLDIKGGMYKLFGSEANGFVRSKSFSHQLSAGYSSSGGYTDNSDYKIFNSFWQSHFQANQSKIDAQVGFNSKAYGANTFYSAAYPNQFDSTQSLFAGIKGELGRKLKFIPQLYWNRHWDCFELFRNGTPNIPSWYMNPNYHQSDVYGLNINMQYSWKAGITNLGGEIRNEGILSNVLGKPMDEPEGKYTKSDNRTNTSYFLQHTFLQEQTTLSVGLLANRNSSLDENFSLYPNINVSYQLLKSLKLYASWSTAMRMPTFTDLYYSSKTNIGNPDLLPEKSESFETGLKYHHHFISGYLTGFYMKGKDIIDWVKENPADLWQSRNLTKLDKIGIETNISLKMQDIFHQMRATNLNVGYMFLNQTKNASNLISNYALDYLKHKVTTQLTHPIYKGLSADWQFRWQKRMGSYTKYENLQPAFEVPYPAYAIFDLKINWQLKNVKVYATINNLFNTSYYDLGNIPQPGFWFSGGISCSIR